MSRFFIDSVARFTTKLQGFLFPELERDHGPLDDTMRKLVAILEVLDVERFVDSRRLRCDGRGRPPHDRGAIARAFVAKAFLKIPDTRALITRLKTTPSLCRICGFDSTSAVPDESTFSRSFAEFSTSGFPERVHETLIHEVFDGRIVGHANRDSSEIAGREKPTKKPPKARRAPRRRGRPRKDEIRETPAPEKRVDLQRTMTIDEMVADLPKVCDVGSKRDSKGHAETWIGYKIHADVADCGIAISLLLTSASLHDSQAAIPLMTMTRGRVTHLYENMDAAYDSAAIRDHCIAGGQIPIIDSNPRRGEKRTMDPAKGRRYDERTTVERFFARLKDEFGGRSVMVRGWRKVMAHLMFGILAMTGDCVLKLAN